MNIREACFAAADHIEANPHLFNFSTIHIPDCRTPGCALGWVASFVGDRAIIGRVFKSEFMGVDSDKFYVRMREWFGFAWRRDAQTCAKALRLYADKYHPAEEESYPEISAELTRIFEREAVAA